MARRLEAWMTRIWFVFMVGCLAAASITHPRRVTTPWSVPSGDEHIDDVVHTVLDHVRADFDQLFDDWRRSSGPSVSTDPAEPDMAKAADRSSPRSSMGFEAEAVRTDGHPVVPPTGRAPGTHRPLLRPLRRRPPIPSSCGTRPVRAVDRRHAGGRPHRGARRVDDRAGDVLRRGLPSVAGRPFAAVGVTVMLEGEEVGIVDLEAFLDSADKLAADVCVVSDTGMWDTEAPYRPQGMCYLEAEVRGPGHDLHPGCTAGRSRIRNVLSRIILHATRRGESRFATAASRGLQATCSTGGGPSASTSRIPQVPRSPPRTVARPTAPCSTDVARPTSTSAVLERLHSMGAGGLPRPRRRILSTGARAGSRWIEASLRSFISPACRNFTQPAFVLNVPGRVRRGRVAPRRDLACSRHAALIGTGSIPRSRRSSALGADALLVGFGLGDKCPWSSSSTCGATRRHPQPRACSRGVPAGPFGRAAPESALDGRSRSSNRLGRPADVRGRGSRGRTGTASGSTRTKSVRGRCATMAKSGSCQDPRPDKDGLGDVGVPPTRSGTGIRRRPATMLKPGGTEQQAGPRACGRPRRLASLRRSSSPSPSSCSSRRPPAEPPSTWMVRVRAQPGQAAVDAARRRATLVRQIPGLICEVRIRRRRRRTPGRDPRPGGEISTWLIGDLPRPPTPRTSRGNPGWSRPSTTATVPWRSPRPGRPDVGAAKAVSRTRPRRGIGPSHAGLDGYGPLAGALVGFREMTVTSTASNPATSTTGARSLQHDRVGGEGSLTTRPPSSAARPHRRPSTGSNVAATS